MIALTPRMRMRMRVLVAVAPADFRCGIDASWGRLLLRGGPTV
jgi:hypothetical protein